MDFDSNHQISLLSTGCTKEGSHLEMSTKDFEVHNEVQTPANPSRKQTLKSCDIKYIKGNRLIFTTLNTATQVVLHV